MADWLVGINGTRAISIKAGGQTLLSVGRVQTPTLHLIVKRYLEHINFKPQTYWQPEMVLSYKEQEFKATYFERLTDRVGGQQILQSIQSLGTTVLVKADKKERTELPPLLFDLTGLQKKANRLFGYGAKDTLAIAQKLYENKLISYPRTDSKYLTDDMKVEMPGILQSIRIKDLQPAIKSLEVHQLSYNKRNFNNQKVNDHHAILPTTVVPKTLTERESNIYQLIASSFVIIFMPPCLKLNTIYHFEPSGYKFLSKGTVILNEGWRQAELFKEEKKELEKKLPEIAEGTSVEIIEVLNKDKQTKAPPLLTVATLLALMENAGKLVEEETEEILNKFGIGTPATRAGIIDILFKRSYIVEKAKKLSPTETGLMLYNLTSDLHISNVEMTGQWEYKLQQIAAGEHPVIAFKGAIESYTNEIVTQIKTMQVQRSDLLLCPKCQQKTMIDKVKLLSCTSNNCDFVLWKNRSGKKLSENQIKQLLTKGFTNKIKGFKNREGKKFDAALTIDDTYKVTFMF